MVFVMVCLSPVVFVLATVTLLACGPQRGAPSPDAGAGGSPGADGGPGGAGAGPCYCPSPSLAASCEVLCVMGAAHGCSTPCGECVETQGQGRRAFVCNGTPEGLTIYFVADGGPHVCDGYAVDHCPPGTDCAAVSDGGMLVGACL